MPALTRNTFAKEHNAVSTATTGTNTYTLSAAAQGVVIKVELQNNAATQPSCVIRVLWISGDLTTKQFQQQTSVNLDIQADTQQTGTPPLWRHGSELNFNSSGARALRVDVGSIAGSGAVSVWVAAL